MNIYALPGHIVKVTEDSIAYGYDVDKKRAAKYLTVGSTYTIAHTEVDNYSTDVYLEEFPNIYFNSVHFEDVTEQDLELDKSHPDWDRYN
jgi:hypothetical protein